MSIIIAAALVDFVVAVSVWGAIGLVGGGLGFPFSAGKDRLPAADFVVADYGFGQAAEETTFLFPTA